MKTRVSSVFLLSAILLLTHLFVSCGGANTPPKTVTVSPASVSLMGGETQQFTATVSGTTATAVTWSVSGCSGADCGTISSSGLYTAPSPIPSAVAVTVLATLQTDSKTYGSGRVTHVPIQVEQPDPPVVTGAGSISQLSATVTGCSNKSVTWSITSCSVSDCGSIDQNGVLTAPTLIPSDGAAVVKATSVSDPTKSHDRTVNLKAVSLSLTPSPAIDLNVGVSQDFTAEVSFDSNSAGVTWSLAPCSADECGALSNTTSTTVKYTAPASVPDPATVSLTATSVTDSTKKSSVAITIKEPDAGPLKPGDYAFVFNGWEQVNQVPSRLAIVGRFHANANGTITDGVQDVNSSSGTAQSQAFTGTYTVNQNRRGTLTITAGSETATYSMVVDSSGTKANFIRFDNPIPARAVSGSGYFEAQTSSAFDPAVVAGSYALQFAAKPDNFNFAAIGRMTVDAAGVISGGLMDMVDGNASYNNQTLTGSLTSPSGTIGRGTASLVVNPQPGTRSGTMNFAYYVVSANKLLFVQSDTRSSTVLDLSGEARRQTATYSTAAWNSPAIFRMEGMFGTIQTVMIGQFSPGGNGNLTGVRDLNSASNVYLNHPFSGSYAVDPSGRMTLTMEYGDGIVGYFFGQYEGYLVIPGTADVIAGSFKPQTGGPFGPASLAATFRHGEPGALSLFSECDSGITTFDGSGAFLGEQDYTYFNTDGNNNYFYHASPQNISGSYTMDANGRGTVTISGWPLVIWAVSPDEIVALDTASSNDSLPVILQYLK